jgi:hypothetical protein
MKATYMRRGAKDIFFAIRSNNGSRVVSLIRKEVDRHMANGLSSWVGSAGPGALGIGAPLGMNTPGIGSSLFSSPLNGGLGFGGLLGTTTPFATAAPLLGIPAPASFWWGSPTGWTDLDLYDYNNNLMLDDNEIADIVADNIHLDPFIPLSDERNMNIEVRGGVVTLSGTVRNPRVKPLAYADAFWSPGVVDVIDNIQVQPMQRRTDQQQGQQQALPQHGQQQALPQQGQQQAAPQQRQQQAAASQQGAQQAASQREQQPARRTVGR